MNLNIKQKILFIIAIIYCPMMAFSALFIYRNYSAVTHEILTVNQRDAADTAESIGSTVERAFAVLDALAQHPAVQRIDSNEMDRLFAGMKEKYRVHLNFLFADMQGDNRGSGISGSTARTLNYTDMEWFVQARSGKKFVGNLHRSKLMKRPATMISAPVYDTKGAAIGVIGMPLDLDEITRILQRKGTAGRQISITVLDRKGAVIASTARSAGEEYGSAPAAGADLSRVSESFVTEDRNGIKRLYSIARVPDALWTVVVDVPAVAAYGEVMAIARENMILMTAVSLVVALIALFITGRISRNVRGIIEGIQKISEGRRDVSIRIEGKDELSRIGAAFNEMVTGIVVTEARIEESERFVRNVIEGIGLAMAVYDTELKILMQNNRHRQLCDSFTTTGAEAHAVHEGICLAKKEDGSDCVLVMAAGTGVAMHGTTELRDRDGNRAVIEIEAYPVRTEKGTVQYLVQTIKDITEKKGLEEKLMQSQKMEAVGLLAGGVAHDFNNILTSILGYGELIGLDQGLSPKTRGYAQTIVEASEKAASLTRALLAFSRKQVFEPKPVNLNIIIENIAKLLRRVIGERIELRLILAPDAIPVHADTGQVEQVIMNLATNARDAMKGCGTLSLETGIASFESDQQTNCGMVRKGTYMLLAVADTGSGIDPALMDKIFEPFFTTKETGKGTGLGLAIVHGIVQQHKGFINVYSEQGRGTIFKVYLPVSEEEAPGTTDLQTAFHPRQGRELILVADDDATILGFMAEILSRQGYRVITALNGTEALSQFRNHMNELDLIILDVIMPGMNGRDVARSILAERSDMKILFMSGYTRDTIDESLGDMHTGYITKPASANTILEKIALALDSRR